MQVLCIIQTVDATAFNLKTETMNTVGRYHYDDEGTCCKKMSAKDMTLAKACTPCSATALYSDGADFD